MKKRYLFSLISVVFFASCIATAICGKNTRAADKVCYITFDDGPTLNTPDIVKTLNRHNANATFFVLEERIRLYPDYIRDILRADNAVGLHGISHSDAIYAATTSPANEMDAADKALYEISGVHSRLVRVPYGSSYRLTQAQYSVLKERGYLLWDWNVDPRDSVGKIYPEKIMQNLRRGLKCTSNSPIILFHDRKSTARLLDEVLTYLKAEGYEMLPLSEKMQPENAMEK